MSELKLKEFKGFIFIIILILLGVGIGVFISSKISGALPKKYVAVYLVTGDIYFGKIKWFPYPQLSDVVLLQRTQDQGLTVDRFSNAVWKPQEPMRLSKDKIVFWTYLSSESPIVAFIENKLATQQQPQASTPNSNPVPTPTPQETQK
jgi:ABC-type antimicrobial peptide transport system permease subunit